ncbi:MAG: nicotinamide-nucleotide amidohydrolase family protein [Ginsengibacter sp.]
MNLLQAKVPDVCEVIQNRRGSAPGMIFRKKGVVFISMPGIPYEMEGIMEEVIPYLKNLFELPVIVHKTILTAGIGESALAEKIADFENSLPREIKLAYLPNYGMVRLRLSSVIFANRLNEPTILQEFELLKKLVEDYIVTDEDETMEMVLGKVLTSAGKTVSTAESCTGGRIAALITSVPGASNYFEGGIVSYSNDIKKNNLQVKEETLNLYGAVSEEAAKEMLTGLLKKFSTDFGIAVTGIMGPDGGTPEKPVGTVWVAVGNKDSYVSRCFHQRFKRSKNIEVTSVMAINMLREFILKSS